MLVFGKCGPGISLFEVLSWLPIRGFKNMAPVATLMERSTCVQHKCDLQTYAGQVHIT